MSASPESAVADSMMLTDEAADNAPTRYTAPGPAFCWTVRLLILVAIGISAYLLWFTLSGKAVPGCDPDAGCGKVLTSKWSKWMGAPVSAPAIVMYGVLLMTTFLIGSNVEKSKLRTVWKFMIFFAMIVLAAAVWFICLQLFVLKEICPYCMVAHGAGLIVGLAILFRAPIGATRLSPDEPEDPVYIAPGKLTPAILFTVVAMAVLLAGQVNSKSTGGVVVKGPLGDDVFDTGKDDPKRRIAIFGGKVVMSPGELPMLGNPKADYMLVYLFDYTCPSCRAMHGYLEALIKKHGDKFAVVCLPNPLNHRCNPMVKRTGHKHVEACHFARTAMAVWHADPKKFVEFDKWLLEDEQALPLPSAATRKAEEMIGKEKLQELLDAKKPEEIISRGTMLYKLTNGGALPKVFWLNSYMSGGPGNAKDFIKFFEEQMKLTPADNK